MRFEPDVKTELRRLIMKKGLEIATLLADVLAGKDKKRELDALPMYDKPGERPEEKLRRYLDHIESKRALIDADDDAFGRCEECAVDLGEPALREMPWADRCPAHAS